MEIFAILAWIGGSIALYMFLAKSDEWEWHKGKQRFVDWTKSYNGIKWNPVTRRWEKQDKN